MSIGRPRSTPAITGSTCKVLVGSDDGSCHLRQLEKLAVIGGNEIGVDLGGHLAPTLGTRFGDANPLHGRMPSCHLAPEEADATGAAFRRAASHLPLIAQ
jgi:hypothetical protein